MKPPFRVIVAGSRSFSDMELMKKKCDHILKEKNKTHDVCIISGTANGADQCGERYAQEKGYKVMRFPADWHQYGKRGGMIRNIEMLSHADAVIVFWDGLSRGSKHMMSISAEKGTPLRVIRF